MFTALGTIARDGWQPLLVNYAMPEHYLGYLYTILAIMVIIILSSLRVLVEKMKKNHAISFVLALQVGVTLTLLYVYPPLFYYVALLFLLTNTIPNISRPIEQTYLQKFIPSKKRATITSVKVMIESLVSAVFLVPIGFLMDIIGPKLVIVLTSLFFIPAIFIYMGIKEK